MTNLVASLIVHNEVDRYLRPCLDHLLEFCDEIRVLDDGSTDDFQMHAWHGDSRVHVMRTSESLFFEHEGRARQALLEWTFEANPSHILAIDADEFVADGDAVRKLVEQGRQQVATLNMVEIWYADRAGLKSREDGGWKAHPVPILYAVPARRNPYHWRMRDVALACGREPKAVTAIRNRARTPVSDVLHFGWANVADRRARYERYVTADGGKFHRSAHLDSIMLDDSQVAMRQRPWPNQLEAYVDEVADRAMRGAVIAREIVRVDGELTVRPATAADLPWVEIPSQHRRLPDADEYAIWKKHPDGRFVGVKWDGTVEHGVDA